MVFVDFCLNMNYNELIRAISDHLQISPKTVDRALNYTGNTKRETSLRVEECAKLLCPDYLRIVQRRKSTTHKLNIAVIMPYKPRMYWHNIIDGITTATNSPEYDVDVDYMFYSNDRDSKELMSMLYRVEAGYDALILVMAHSSDVQIKLKEIVQSIPVVALSEPSQVSYQNNFVSIYSNGYEEGVFLAEMLKNSPLDEKRVLIFRDVSSSTLHRERLAGFLDGIEQCSSIMVCGVIDINDALHRERDSHFFMTSYYSRLISDYISKCNNEIRFNCLYCQMGKLQYLFSALKKLQLTDIYCLGYELYDSTLEAVENNEFKGAFVITDTFMQGYISATQAIKMIKNNTDGHYIEYTDIVIPFQSKASDSPGGIET